MTSARVVVIACAALALVGAGCGEEEHHDPAAEAEARTLLADLQQQGYRSFTRAPGWETPRQSGTTDHHGAFLDVYVNDTLAQAIAGGGTAPWPEGSILIKDGWSDAGGTTLFQIAVARKEPGGAWFGAEFSATGEVTEAGVNFEECQGCHGGGDFVRSF